MKVPAPPPSLDSLMTTMAERGRLVQVLSRQRVGGTMSDEYLPWDKLRFKAPPGDLTVEEWWAAIRLARRSVQRNVDLLRSKSGEPFSYTLPDKVLQNLDHIARSASGQIAISEQVTNSATRDRYLINSLIEEAITSSQLEGAATSRRVAKRMIRTGRPPADRSERMILNNYVAMRRIVELRDQDLTPELVCEIHRIVTEGTLDDPDAAGAVQDDDATRIAVWGDGDQVLHRPPPVAQLPDRLRALCDFANGCDGETYVPPVLRAVTVHFMIGYDHYFEDGNGRTARALFYWVMLREGYWLAEFLTISRILKKSPSKYARSFLLTEDDDGDLTHFFVFHLEIICKAIAELHEYLAVKADELRAVQKTIRAKPGEFNHRELAVLEHAVKNPGAAYTVQSHGSSHNASLETARQDLSALERRGLLVRAKVGKRFVWSPVDDLAKRLGL